MENGMENEISRSENHVRNNSAGGTKEKAPTVANCSLGKFIPDIMLT